VHDTKHLTTRAVLKADGDGEGSIEAVFSTFNVVDRGNDIVLPGAIEHGKEVPMVWAHDWSKIVGKGVTEVTPERAVYKGQFFLDTTAGMDAYRTVKNMGALQEFSWGFLINAADYAERDGQTVRLIKSTELFEVSPVLVGEGRGTGTLALKYGQPFDEQCDTALAAVTHIVDRWKSLADSIVKEGRPISESRRGRMGAIAEQLDAASADLRAILKETEPAKTADIDWNALWVAQMALNAKQNGIHL
jgi:HK97 family phage prohead protease